jgi:hypothetical protein
MKMANPLSPPLAKGRCEKIQESRSGRGDIWKNVERLPFPVLFVKIQRPYKINNLEALKSIKLNVRILHFGRYSHVLLTSPHFFTASGGWGIRKLFFKQGMRRCLIQGILPFMDLRINSNDCWKYFTESNLDRSHYPMIRVYRQREFDKRGNEEQS